LREKETLRLVYSRKLCQNVLMKKAPIVWPMALLLAFLPSCAADQPEVSSEVTPPISSDSQDAELQEIAEALAECSGPNITYQGDVSFYAYPIGSPLDVIQLDGYYTTAKYAEGLFSFEAKIKGSSSIYTSYSLERDENGYASYPHIDLWGKVQREEALSTNGNPIKWDESIYRNLLPYVSTSDLSLTDQNRYRLSSDDAAELLSSIGTAATYTSSLPASRVDHGDFYLSANGSLCLFIQERETTEVYEGYYYGRTITLTFAGVGSTEIEKIEDLPEKTENEALKTALENVRSQTQYAISISGVTANRSIVYETDEFLEDGFLRSLTTDDGLDYVYSGRASIDGADYEFASNDKNRLIGKAASEGDDGRPSFAFTHNLFSLMERSDDGSASFSVFNYPEVLDYISLDAGLSGSFYNGFGEEIVFEIKNGYLDKVLVPAYLSIDGEAVQGKLVISYSYAAPGQDAENVLKSVIAYENAPSFSSLDQIRLSNNESGYSNVQEFFNAVVGSHDDGAIPLFVPSDIKRLEEGSLLSASDEEAIVVLAAPEGDHASSDALEDIRETFRSASWSVNGKSFAEGVRFTKSINDVSIEIVIIDSALGGMEIPFEATITVTKKS